jgi:hypothetical protein
MGTPSLRIRRDPEQRELTRVIFGIDRPWPICQRFGAEGSSAAERKKRDEARRHRLGRRSVQTSRHCGLLGVRVGGTPGPKNRRVH